MPAWNPFRSRPAASPAAALYAAIVERARDPRFYLLGGVPDSLDGRFEMVALHGYLVLRRLRGQGEAAEAIRIPVFLAQWARIASSSRATM